MARAFWASCFAVLVLTTSNAENWPGWRGPRHDGTSLATSLPLHWSADKNIAWKVKIDGTGHASPVIWQDRVFVASCNEFTKARKLICLNRLTGQEIWTSFIVTALLEPKHQLNSYASSTPATDGEHVYTTFLDNFRIVVACHDFSGGEIWKTWPGEFHSMHGFCSPPLLYKNLVIINGDHDVDEANKLAYLVALDKLTGKEVWRADRPHRTRSYCPPVVFQAGGREQLVISGSHCICSYDPATGQELWRVDGPTEQFAASLVQHDDLLFMTGGFPERHLMAIRPDGTGNVTKTHVAWHHPRGAAYVPSPIAIDHLLYLVTDEGVLNCFDTRTGKQHFQERLGRKFLASPVAAGDYLYFPGQEGVTYVVKKGLRLEVVARNDLKEEIFASPAVFGDNLFLRTTSHLYCIGNPPR
jgi:outer membrane protein assembly factor BamB